MRKTIILEIFILMLFLLFIPISYSNGGCIKLADDILVQMTVAPHVPIAREKASFLFSFGSKDGLLRKDINGKIRIMQNDKVWIENNFTAKDGILDMKHLFNDPGLYEIFLEFNINNKEYMPEDFVVEVIEKQEGNGYLANVLFLMAGFLIGILSARFFKGRK